MASSLATSISGFFSKAAEKAKEVKNSDVMSTTLNNVKDGVNTAVNSDFVQGLKDTVVDIAQDVKETKSIVTSISTSEYDSKMNLDQFLQMEDDRLKKEQAALAEAEAAAQRALEIGIGGEDGQQ